MFSLSEVKLARFKAAFKPDPIPLQGFNVLIGRNGSGKSTVVEALQWIDTAIRHDARKACERYWGIRDLINLRSRTEVLYFNLTLTWNAQTRYDLRVADIDSAPAITVEELCLLNEQGRPAKRFISIGTEGQRVIDPYGDARTNQGFMQTDSERLALSIVPSLRANGTNDALAEVRDFWKRAVFLRLSPNRLADGSLAQRKSFEPLLDEEGQNLPALLAELDPEQRKELVSNIREILEGIRGVEVSAAPVGRDTKVHYSLTERMPYRGRSGQSDFPIPAWMLSEGTRRITAILALLAHEPPPSLLCIEEIENGLDPWTTLNILKHLKSAVRKGTQVIVTTHSPWLLDNVDLDCILQVRRVDGDTRYEKFANRKEVKAFAKSVPAGTLYVNQ